MADISVGYSIENGQEDRVTVRTGDWTAYLTRQEAEAIAHLLIAAANYDSGYITPEEAQLRIKHMMRGTIPPRDSRLRGDDATDS